ncbi:MAG: major capsid protein [Microviridae sp.]|nr:MAG: major capsid protein [Microviridae sp.]
MQTTIGGDRLGSGSKETVSFRNYERSTHDLGYVWRSSMASGTLVPFMTRVGLPGDKWEIDLNCEVLTLPTTGPLFGSYKVQLDVFEVPIRLYNAKLHMNRLGIGMDMKSILLPQVQVRTANKFLQGSTPTYDDNEQINSSSLLKYLGISGLGSYIEATGNPVTREFNAVPLLSFWDIYKNYYSNKQEEIGYMIHTSDAIIDGIQTPITAILRTELGNLKGDCLAPLEYRMTTGDNCKITYQPQAVEPDPKQINILLEDVASTLDTVFTTFAWDESTKTLNCIGVKAEHDTRTLSVNKEPSQPLNQPTSIFGVEQFPLENIDKMRDLILQFTGTGPFKIVQNSMMPYSASLQPITTESGTEYAVIHSQEGLGLKTYQSDLFNNWINTEWIDGAGGISELTAVDTTTGEFTIDALNIATKVYEMLNRIAVSGGTYDDWLEAVYTHERVKGVENPVYCGSLIKELAFEEVISLAETSQTDTEGKQTGKSPLGTLAGRGRLTKKNKGGKINITVNEPSYIIGIVSITPRIDYSQGNEWDVNLKTMDDFHKPALDGIGFQDLITEQLLWSDTEIHDDGVPYKFSLGKQPAWINYMTAVNKTYGAFAEVNNSMFMTLNRRYAKTREAGYGGKLKDGTTYIDPSKYNYIWAETALSSQNFWVQIANNITCRRKMSAKIIPNL